MKRILALLLAFLLLTGCTVGQQSYVPTGDGLTPNTPGNPGNSSGGEDTAKAFSLAYYEKEGLNPLTSIDYVNRTVASLLYQGLFSVDRNYKVEPVLCSSYTVSSNMKSYVFYLEEATFSDGSAVTAEDVVASLKAAKSSDYYGGRFTHIKSISATSDGGVSIKLTKDCENLPILLDIPIVPKNQVKEKFPMGSGPYAVVETNSGRTLVLRSDWWCSAQLPISAGTIPLSKRKDPVDIRDGFEFENVGLTCTDPGASSYADYHCDCEQWECETGLFLFLGCNEESEVFSIQEVRQALTYAIDREKIVQENYRGFARATTLPVSPASTWYDSALANRYSYDPDRFAEVIKDNKLKGKTVVLLVNGGDSIRLQASRNIEKMLTAAGLVVDRQTLKGSAYTKALKKGNYDLFLGQTKLSPNMDLSEFFYSKGALCFGGMDDGAIYALCQAALENSGNYYNLYQAVARDAMLTPILFRTYAVYAARGLVQGLQPARDNVFYYSLGRSLEDAKKN